MNILSSFSYLVHQTLPLRSYSDPKSNLRQLLILPAEDDPNFMERIQKGTNQFISASIQNVF